MKKTLSVVFGVSLLALSINAHSSEPLLPKVAIDNPAGSAVPSFNLDVNKNEPNPEQLKAFIRLQERGFNVVDMGKGPTDGWRSLYVNDQFTVMDASGDNLFIGSMVDTRTFTDKIQKAKSEFDIQKLESFDSKHIIKFPVLETSASDLKATMWVFTDTSCPYCALQHEGVQELNENGIEVKYIPFMRGFPQTGAPGYTSMNDVWSREGEDRTDRFNAWKLSNKLGVDPENPQSSKEGMKALSEGFQLGKQLGVNGTPHTIIKIHGDKGGVMIQNGYAPAAKTIEAINQAIR